MKGSEFIFMHRLKEPSGTENFCLSYQKKMWN